jgi:hypothetical protein
VVLWNGSSSASPRIGPHLSIIKSKSRYLGSFICLLRLVDVDKQEQHHMTTTNCCAECGADGGVSLKTCKSCMDAKYCDATCQRNHWPMHKKDCKLRVAELRDEALFQDPPPKEECPICFLPMPLELLCCVTLPDATVTSVPIYDFGKANEGLQGFTTEKY